MDPGMSRQRGAPRKPPARLPRRYHGIWRALSEADAGSASRQALARRLGLSTLTLQRILVRGDVPNFSRAQSTRVVRAWTRTLLRLADRLGHDGLEWLTAVGIPRGEAARIATGSAARHRAFPPSDGSRSEPSGSLRIALATPGILAAPLPALSTSFGEAFGRLLAGAIDPTLHLRFERRSEGEIAADLLAATPAARIGIGVFDTVYRRRLGLACRPIPGWRVPLDGIRIRPRRDRAAEPRWLEVVASSGDGPRLLAGANGVARAHLQGPCGVPESRLRPIGDGWSEASDLLLAEAMTPGDGERSSIYIADRFACRRVAQAIEESRRLPESHELSFLGDPEGETPAFPVGLATSPRWLPWAEWIHIAWEREVFGTNETHTAALYAELLSVEAERRMPSDPFVIPPSRGLAILADFAEASSGFVEACCRRLAENLAQLVIRRVGTGPERHWATLLALRHARPLLPDRWLPACDRLREAPEPRTAPRCQSCSVSLLDRHNQGVSDRFCRYCSDESGRLLPREEVRRLIADWFRSWQPGVTEENVVRRADLYMELMPAWSAN